MGVSSRQSRVLLVFLLVLGGSLRWASAQKYAPIIGAWRVKLDVEGSKETLGFATAGEGFYGRGAGCFTLEDKDGGSHSLPAVWTNTNPQQISINGDVVLNLGGRGEPGTLVLRLALAPGKGFAGDAVFIDAKLASHRGTFEMERTLYPEEILSHPSTCPAWGASP
jgi:hypothetical protein